MPLTEPEIDRLLRTFEQRESEQTWQSFEQALQQLKQYDKQRDPLLMIAVRRLKDKISQCVPELINTNIHNSLCY